MHRLFDESFRGFFDRRGTTRRFPPANVYETPADVIVRAELPGVAVDDVEVTITGDTLKLEGARKLEIPDGASFLCQERQHGDFTRVLNLPRLVDAGQAKAEYADGILTITVPKTAEARPRTIQVKGT
jgi:HSP20 family protein